LADYTDVTLPVVAYLTLVALLQIVSTCLFEDFGDSWTLTNVVHTALTIVTVHWLKGSIYDSQGEMSYLTYWEQLEATSETTTLRMWLLVVPTLLCYAGCHFNDYDGTACLQNILCWFVAVLAKLPCMNGVRLFGINRTVGIDDETDGDDVPDFSNSSNNNDNNPSSNQPQQKVSSSNGGINDNKKRR